MNLFWYKFICHSRHVRLALYGKVHGSRFSFNRICFMIQARHLTRTSNVPLLALFILTSNPLIFHFYELKQYTMKTAEIDSADENGGGVAIAYSKRKDRDDESRRRARFLATQSISNGDTLYCQEVNSNSSDMLPFNNTGALYSDSDDSLGLGLGSNRHRPRKKREFNKCCTSSFCTSQSSSSFYESSSDEDESMHGIDSDVSLTPHRSSFCNSLSSAVLPPVSFESESPDSSMDASFSFEEKDGEFTSKNSTIRAGNLESLEALKASEAAKQKLIQAQFFRADKFYLDGSNLSFETPNDGTHHSNGQKSARTHVEPSHTHQNTDKNITSPQLVKLCIKGVKGIEKEEVSRFINGRCHDVEFTLDQPSMSGNVFLTVPKQYEERITREIDAVTFQGRVLRAKRAHPHNQPPHTPIQCKLFCNCYSLGFCA